MRGAIGSDVSMDFYIGDNTFELTGVSSAIRRGWAFTRWSEDLNWSRTH
jgi:hypothetical protein